MPRLSKSFFRNIFASKLLLIIGIVVLILVSINLLKVIAKKREVMREFRNLEDKIKQLEEHNSELTNFMAYLRTEAFEEEAARLQLGFKMPGEQVVAIVSPVASSSKVEPQMLNNVESSEPAEKTDLINNPYKWWRYFFSDDYDLK